LSPAGRAEFSSRGAGTAAYDTDWEEIRELVTEGYRIFAPKKLTALLD
jgi:hypothetical protein